LPFLSRTFSGRVIADHRQKRQGQDHRLVDRRQAGQVDDKALGQEQIADHRGPDQRRVPGQAAHRDRGEEREREQDEIGHAR
jgi:hypothetical protein